MLSGNEDIPGGRVHSKELRHLSEVRQLQPVLTEILTSKVKLSPCCLHAQTHSNHIDGFGSSKFFLNLVLTS